MHRLLLLASIVCINGILSAAERPNILFIIADDASRDSFGVYGSSYVKTPGFDRIAREGVLFTQAYNCNPKCAPARACLLTGRYSWQLEEACNHNPFLSEKWKFYPYLLEEQGYQIGYTGKGWGPGIWKNTDASRDAKSDNPAGHQYNDLKSKPPYAGISNIDYAANFEAFLQATAGGDAPFCFWFGTKEPHRGYGLDNWKLDGRDLADVKVPAYFPDNATIRGDLADYAIEVEWFDEHIQRAIGHLADSGKLDNTLIIATSDHGMPFPRVKGQIYDDGFHIPLVVRWGDKIKPGRNVTDFITFPDLAPTLMEVAGVESHPQMTGKSFLPQLLSEKSGRLDATRNHTLLGKERHDIGRTDGELLSVAYPARAIRTDRFLYVRNFKPDRWPVGNPELGLLNCDGSPTKSYLTKLASDSVEYVYYEMSFGKRPAEELYDIEADPDCVKNLATAPEYAVVMAKLWTQLQTELEEQGDPRILGQGDIFDFYPYSKIDRQQKLYEKPDYDPVRIFESKFAE
ncbi:Arylsulfatase [Planctomycetes bacterium CA13]|uniref:Arylsulfatase n=1 Tax=Novipirellula herctigrandis TaxID=2527986 RepID=A0A5C5Z2E8_9BACT|nr:Arylsulfatase [Planctomycetes bacterium CA13]